MIFLYVCTVSKIKIISFPVLLYLWSRFRLFCTVLINIYCHTAKINKCIWMYKIFIDLNLSKKINSSSVCPYKLNQMFYLYSWYNIKYQTSVIRLFIQTIQKENVHNSCYKFLS